MMSSCIRVVRVPVNPGREWQEAINAVGPNTDQDSAVRKVGEKYPPQPGELQEREIILANFGRTIPDTQYALDWAKPFKLHPESPRGIFAIGEHEAQLYGEFGLRGMGIISLSFCSFEDEHQVCGVWLEGPKRRAHLYGFKGGWVSDYWFAFSYK